MLETHLPSLSAQNVPTGATGVFLSAGWGVGGVLPFKRIQPTKYLVTSFTNCLQRFILEIELLAL